MTDLAFQPLGDGAVAIELDGAVYPRDAVFAAAFTFVDRCWVHLDRAEGGRLAVTLRPKAAAPAGADRLAAELEDELAAEAWRQALAEESRALVERVTVAALGPATGSAPAGAASGDAPPLQDDLLGADAFEDPLGIALSWEEKYAKKGAQALDPAVTPIDDTPSETKGPGA
jgi:His-Xaa-Ser system protein HxsD